MKFFFEKWKEEKELDISSCLFASSFSTRFTANGVPFSATFDSLVDSDIYIYHEPEHSEATVIYNELNETRTSHVEILVKNYFEDAVALADLIRNEKLKRMEDTQ